VTQVATTVGCAAQRNASILLWLPFLLIAPAFELPGEPAALVAQVILLVTMAGATVVAVLSSQTGGRLPYVALAVLGAAVAAGATTEVAAWLPTWILAAIAAPAVLRGWAVFAWISTAGLGSTWAVSMATGGTVTRMWTQAFVVLLSGVTTTFFLRLLDTIQELRRTREELARLAVAEERERFSRDLHDLLGHTLSVMVVKAQAVRRLAGRDPVAAAEHAGDIERVGREALVEVREAVDAMRALTLREELEGARRALDAAGIRAEVQAYGGDMPEQVDQAFAWVVREGATNVLRHSRAGTCRFLVGARDGELVLTVADDGVGGQSGADGRRGGLDGLRHRVAAAGGELDVQPETDGFRLTARIPQPEVVR
jgi:two-component system sensor histidine kinase DesK